MALTQSQIEFPKVFITGPSGFIADVNSQGQLLTSGSGGGGGVTTLNTLTGAITLAAGTGITITPSGNTLTIASTGSGTVTSFSSGNLDAIATTSVATPTTTPALTFTLSTQTANTVWAGPTTGSAAAPTFRALVAADLPAGTGTVTSVSFTGGLISIATPTTTPALTIAGTSGGIPYFSSATTWASSAILAATGLVIGGGAGTAPATNTALTFTGATLTVGLAGTSSGILALAGSTSGQATFTAPAIAGTASNAVTMSNAILGPMLGGAVPTYSFTGATTTGLGWDTGAGSMTFAIAGSEAYRFAANLLEVSGASFGIIWNNAGNMGGSFDLGLFRAGAGVLEISNSSSANALGSLNLAKITNYNAVATTGAGVPSEVGVVTATTASAAVTATTLLAAPVAGTLYRVSAYLKITVATTTPVAGPITLTYKDNDGVAQSIVMPLANATGAVVAPWATGSTTTTPVNGNSYIYAGAGTAIAYAIAFSGTGTYEYLLVCEAL